MTLGSQVVKNQYTRLMRDLWVKWDAPPIPEKNRVLQLERIIKTIAPGIPVPAVYTDRLGPATRGTFMHRDWALCLNELFFDEGEYTYRRFLMMATTVYHEVRHAEQFYRCLQALFFGYAQLPDHHFQLVPLDPETFGQMSVQQKVDLYQYQLPDRQQTISPGMLANRMQVPIEIALAAKNSSLRDFQNFINLSKDWYVRGQAKNEIQKWVNHIVTGPIYCARNQTKYSRDEVWANSSNRPFDEDTLAHNRQRIYQTSPLEKDTHHIQTNIERPIEGLIGVARTQETRDCKRGDKIFKHLNKK